MSRPGQDTGRTGYGEWRRAVAFSHAPTVACSDGFTHVAPEAHRTASPADESWATTNARITRPDGMHVFPRWSADFHLEVGVWKFVQTHASVGVLNQDVGWEYSRER